MIAISLGGSVINPGRVNIKGLKGLLGIFNNSKEKLFIVTGGGRYSREYIGAVEELGGSRIEGDLVAILETKQNAALVLSGLKDAYPKVVESFEEGRMAIQKYPRAVAGGMFPGMTTDAITVLFADYIKAKRIINISDVDGIYDKDPRKYKDAKKLKALSFDELVEMAEKFDKRRAGEHFVFDVLASKLAAQMRIPLHFVSWKREKDIINAISGKNHGGSVVK